MSLPHGSEAHTAYTDLADSMSGAAGAPGAAGSTRITSKHRGLYFDSKHSAWRVRIFYTGRQRHIGRFKDETMAAQAYDRAAFYLYGTRANLNFSLQEVLADTGEVPASIRQAKEQPNARIHWHPHWHHGSRFSGSVSASSGGSSTCGYSPSVLAFSPAVAFAPGAAGHCLYPTPPGLLGQQQPQQQFVAQQQAMMAGAALEQPVCVQVPQQQQYQQQYAQQLAVSAGIVQVHSTSHQQALASWMQQPQPPGVLLQPPGVLLQPPGVLLQPGMQQPGPLMPPPGLHPQQPGGVMPEVVASVIAALDLPPQSLPQAATHAASSSSGVSTSTAFQMQAPGALPPPGMPQPGAPGVSGSMTSLLLGQDGTLAAGMVPQGCDHVASQPMAAFGSMLSTQQQQQQQLSCQVAVPYECSHADMTPQQGWPSVSWQQQQQPVVQGPQQLQVQMHSQQPAMQLCVPAGATVAPAPPACGGLPDNAPGPSPQLAAAAAPGVVVTSQAALGAATIMPW